MNLVWLYGCKHCRLWAVFLTQGPDLLPQHISQQAWAVYPGATSIPKPALLLQDPCVQGKGLADGRQVPCLGPAASSAGPACSAPVDSVGWAATKAGSCSQHSHLLALLTLLCRVGVHFFENRWERRDSRNPHVAEGSPLLSLLRAVPPLTFPFTVVLARLPGSVSLQGTMLPRWAGGPSRPPYPLWRCPRWQGRRCSMRPALMGTGSLHSAQGQCTTHL